MSICVYVYVYFCPENNTAKFTCTNRKTLSIWSRCIRTGWRRKSLSAGLTSMLSYILISFAQNDSAVKICALSMFQCSWQQESFRDGSKMETCQQPGGQSVAQRSKNSENSIPSIMSSPSMFVCAASKRRPSNVGSMKAVPRPKFNTPPSRSSRPGTKNACLSCGIHSLT